MEWLIIFVEQLLKMFSPNGCADRPGLVRRSAPAYVHVQGRRAAATRQYTGESYVDQVVEQHGYAWFTPTKSRLRCAPRTPEGPPGG